MYNKKLMYATSTNFHYFIVIITLQQECQPFDKHGPYLRGVFFLLPQIQWTNTNTNTE